MLNNLLSGIQSVRFLYQEFIRIVFARCIFSMSRDPALCCRLSVIHRHISVSVKNHNLNDLLTLPEHQVEYAVFSGISIIRFFSFMCMFCRSLFVLLYFFYWPLCCLSYFDLRILIAPLVSLSVS